MVINALSLAWQEIVVMGYCPIARAQKFGEGIIPLLAQSTLRTDSSSECATSLGSIASHIICTTPRYWLHSLATPDCWSDDDFPCYGCY